MASSVLLLLLLATALADARIAVHGHKFVRFPPLTEPAVAFLRSLPESLDGVTGVDAVTGDIEVGLEAMVRLSPAGYATLASSGLPHTVAVDDVEAHVRAAVSAPPSRGGLDDWFHHWHPYDEIVAKLAEMAKTRPGLVEFLPEIGVSVEGRSIAALKIGSGRNITVLVAGTHGREWIAEGVAMWTTEQLLEEYEAGDEEARHVLDSTTYYVAPCTNPDGYEYARTQNRHWRKNRRDNGDGTFGVDPNRNWDIHWCQFGASNKTSSITYCGTGPFSEPEPRAVSSWILSLGADVVTVADMHSNFQSIMRPYAWTREVTDHEEQLHAIGAEMVTKIKAVHGRQYTNARMSQTYLGTGCTTDWVYEKAGIWRSFTLELGGLSYIVPESDIQRQGEEMYPAVKHLLSQAV